MHQAMDLLIHLQILLTFLFCLIQRFFFFFLEHYTFENFFSTLNFFLSNFPSSSFFYICFYFHSLFIWFFFFFNFFPSSHLFPLLFCFFLCQWKVKNLFGWREKKKKNTQFVKASYKVTYGSKTINLNFASPETFPEKKEKNAKSKFSKKKIIITKPKINLKKNYKISR